MRRATDESSSSNNKIIHSNKPLVSSNPIPFSLFFVVRPKKKKKKTMLGNGVLNKREKK